MALRAGQQHEPAAGDEGESDDNEDEDEDDEEEEDADEEEEDDDEPTCEHCQHYEVSVRGIV